MATAAEAPSPCSLADDELSPSPAVEQCVCCCSAVGNTRHPRLQNSKLCDDCREETTRNTEIANRSFPNLFGAPHVECSLCLAVKDGGIRCQEVNCDRRYCRDCSIILAERAGVPPPRDRMTQLLNEIAMCPSGHSAGWTACRRRAAEASVAKGIWVCLQARKGSRLAVRVVSVQLSERVFFADYCVHNGPLESPTGPFNLSLPDHQVLLQKLKCGSGGEGKEFVVRFSMDDIDILRTIVDVQFCACPLGDSDDCQGIGCEQQQQPSQSAEESQVICRQMVCYECVIHRREDRAVPRTGRRHRSFARGSKSWPAAAEGIDELNCRALSASSLPPHAAASRICPRLFSAPCKLADRDQPDQFTGAGEGHAGDGSKCVWVDLYAGLGSSALAASQRDFAVLAVEHDRHVVDLHEVFTGGATTVKALDVQSLLDERNHWRDYLVGHHYHDRRPRGERSGRLSLGVVFGGCPCQGFSLANANRDSQKAVEDRQCFDTWVKVVARYLPPIAACENVPNILTDKQYRQDAFGSVVSQLLKLGYQVSCKQLNALDYAVQQDRKRLFVVATAPHLSPIEWDNVRLNSNCEELEQINLQSAKSAWLTVKGDFRTITSSRVELMTSDTACCLMGFPMAARRRLKRFTGATENKKFGAVGNCIVFPLMMGLAYELRRVLRDVDDRKTCVPPLTCSSDDDEVVVICDPGRVKRRRSHLAGWGGDVTLSLVDPSSPNRVYLKTQSRPKYRKRSHSHPPDLTQLESAGANRETAIVID